MGERCYFLKLIKEIRHLFQTHNTIFPCCSHKILSITLFPILLSRAPLSVRYASSLDCAGYMWICSLLGWAVVSHMRYNHHFYAPLGEGILKSSTEVRERLSTCLNLHIFDFYLSRCCNFPTIEDDFNIWTAHVAAATNTTNLTKTNEFNTPFFSVSNATKDVLLSNLGRFFGSVLSQP